MNDIGIGFLFIVGLIVIFIGVVMVVQFFYQLDGMFVLVYYIGYVVWDMIIIELVLIFICLVLVGKVGFNIVFEIGGMC